MIKFKRVAALSFLAAMLGVPIVALGNYWSEAKAASDEAVATAKIRYLDETGGDYGTGVYHDNATNANGSVNEEFSIKNPCIKVQFCDKGVKDPYSGKTVKLSTSEYKELAANLKKLDYAPPDNNEKVQNDGAYDGDGDNTQGKDVRYIVWYQFDKQKEAQNYFKTEGYWVTPEEITNLDSPNLNLESEANGFYLLRQEVGGTSFTGKNGQTWDLTIFAVRYDYFRYRYKKLSDSIQEKYEKEDEEGKRMVFWLQPKIAIYKNGSHAFSCHNYVKWRDALQWSDPSSFKSHYNINIAINMKDNNEYLFVHYIQEGTYDSKKLDGTPVVDPKDDPNEVYSRYNIPAKQSQYKEVGIAVASSSTFPYKDGPVAYGSEDSSNRTDIFKDEIETTVKNENGEDEKQKWVVVGAYLVYESEPNKKQQQFQIKFNYDNGQVDSDHCSLVKDNRNSKYEANKPVYTKGAELSYEDFLAKLEKAKVTTAGAGATIVFFEYAQVDWDGTPTDGPGGDTIKIEYQYQTFDSQGNEVWEQLKPDEYVTVPTTRKWSTTFDKLADFFDK